jgi:hypothetical protein
MFNTDEHLLLQVLACECAINYKHTYKLTNPNKCAQACSSLQVLACKCATHHKHTHTHTQADHSKQTCMGMFFNEKDCTH